MNHSHHDVLLRKLRAHSDVSLADEERFRSVSIRRRDLAAGEDFIREGDQPHLSAIVLEGWVARYHTLAQGRRQYLSLHLAGDWPDAQGLFLLRMDHSVCAVGAAAIGTVRHDQLKAICDQSATIVHALWRETLIDASIFRQAITNNSGRDAVGRLAHLFCELYYRAKQADLLKEAMVDLPLSQYQLGEVLGLALVTVNRAVRALRATGSVDFRNAKIVVLNWDKLVRLADFDPAYLFV